MGVSSEANERRLRVPAVIQRHERSVTVGVSLLVLAVLQLTGVITRPTAVAWLAFLLAVTLVRFVVDARAPRLPVWAVSAIVDVVFIATGSGLAKAHMTKSSTVWELAACFLAVTLGTIPTPFAERRRLAREDARRPSAPKTPETYQVNLLRQPHI